MPEHFDVVIIGAGGAGLFCASVAGQRGKSVLVLDHNDKPGKKILISGGGRCNFTNLGAGPEHYRSSNPHFCRSALSRFSPADFIALVDKHGIAYHEKSLGQLFCDGPAKAIVDLLLAECRDAGATVRLGTTIAGITKNADGYTLATSGGSVTCTALVLACGGLSIPTIGATDFGFRLARQFGLAIVPTAPALVPLTLPPDEVADLSGVALDAEVACNGQTFREAILFTHGGLSGPAILQISTWWNPGDAVTINLLPDYELPTVFAERRRTGAKQSLPNLLGDLLPRRLAQRWVERFQIPESVHHLTEAEIRRISATVHSWEVRPTGTEGYRKAEVTRGGISTDELSSKTMEAKKVPGLYAIGEVVDVTGWLGGYNFQWAWASGKAAGLAV